MPTCAALRNHACLDIFGRFTPCCRFSEEPKSYASDVSFAKYRQSAEYQAVIQAMETGWHPGCRKCQSEENVGKASLRDYYNSVMSDQGKKVEFLEINLSNVCNLTCRMCAPSYSTSWQRLFSQNSSLQAFMRPAPESHKTDLTSILTQMDLSQLKIIKYLGGEPFLTPEIKDLFLCLEEAGVIGQVEFSCHTNATLFPEKWIETLKKFRKLTVKFSLDGVGSLANYIRTGASWERVESQIERWLEFRRNHHCRFNVFTTIQAYNIHQIPELSAFADKHRMHFSYHWLYEPDYLSLKALPAEYLQSLMTSELKESHPPIYNKLFEIRSDSELFERLKAFTVEMDRATGQSVHECLPGLAKYF